MTTPQHKQNSTAQIEVLEPGLLTSVQDRGRFGHAALGVGHAGPMDRVCARLANALVGNPEHAALLEITLAGPSLRFNQDAVIALTGTDFDARIDDQPLPMWRPQPIVAGCTVTITAARHGTLGYLAIAGGIAVPPVLGSAATDINAAIGPFEGRALRRGDRLPLAASRQQLVLPDRHHQAWSLDPRPWFDVRAESKLHLIPGPDFDALDDASHAALFAEAFRISARSNRVGYRLDDVPLTLRARVERISEPTAAGTLQLPSGGQPIVLMAEHPTSGGYPRIGQVAAIDLPHLAQRRPGDRVRFAPISLDEAQTRYLERERELANLITAIAERLHP